MIPTFLYILPQKRFSKCRTGNNASDPGAIHLVRTYENFDFLTPPSPLHAPCLLTTSECPLNPNMLQTCTTIVQRYFVTKVLYVHVISTFVHMICMEYDCHIFSKHLVFQFIIPEISTFDRNTWSF